MKIGNFSRTMKNENGDPAYNEGTNAMTFTDARTGTVYVAFRGTSGGEWIDNGRRFNVRNENDLTVQMEQVADYMNRVAKENQWNSNSHVILTGHSQGANDAQLAMLLTEVGTYAKACYSFDGEGHSPWLLDSLKKKYGEEEYNRRVSNIYSICGNNDPVNRFGKKIILPENEKFIECHSPKFLIWKKARDVHDIRSMFCDAEGNCGAINNTCVGVKRGELSYLAENVWKQVEQMPPNMREYAQNGTMQVAQMGLGHEFIGVNGEVATIQDVVETLVFGLDAIAEGIAVTAIERSSCVTVVKVDMSYLVQKVWDRWQNRRYELAYAESPSDYRRVLTEINHDVLTDGVGILSAGDKAASQFCDEIYTGAVEILDGSRETSEIVPIFWKAAISAFHAGVISFGKAEETYEQYEEEIINEIDTLLKNIFNSDK